MKKLIIFLITLLTIVACRVEADNYSAIYITLKNISNLAPCGAYVPTVTGDSNVWKQFWPADVSSPFCNRGALGAQISNIQNAAESIASYPPDPLFIMIGTNDITHGITLTEFEDEYNDLVDYFLLNITCDIYLISIFPQWGIHSGNNTMVEDCNAIIEDIADGNSRIHYIDFYSVLLDHPEAFSDDLHLTRAGFQDWIAPTIQSILGVN